MTSLPPHSAACPTPPVAQGGESLTLNSMVPVLPSQVDDVIGVTGQLVGVLRAVNHPRSVSLPQGQLFQGAVCNREQLIN